jgi:hypothetical protein
MCVTAMAPAATARVCRSSAAVRPSILCRRRAAAAAAAATIRAATRGSGTSRRLASPTGTCSALRPAAAREEAVEREGARELDCRRSAATCSS